MTLPLAVIFIQEGEKLASQGKVSEAVKSLQNALACRDITWSHKMELRLIIAELKLSKK